MEEDWWYPASNLYKDLKGGIRRVVSDTIMRTKNILRDIDRGEVAFNTLSKNEQDTYLLNLFDNVKAAMKSEACADDGHDVCPGLESMAKILKRVPDKKDELIPQMLPILENYTKIFKEGDGCFYGSDLWAVGILYTATAIATTDPKYAPEMLKIFDDNQSHENDMVCENACKYLRKILKVEPSLASEIQRISIGYSKYKGEPYKELQQSISEIMSASSFRIERAREKLGSSQK